jgi:hypothetical protein
MNINLHIEHLILDGLPLNTADSATVQAALQTELTHLLTENGLAPGLQHRDALTGLRTPDVRLSPNPAPDSVGRDIGAAIHEGLRT